MNDPKYLGLEPLYDGVHFLGEVTLYAVPAWLVAVLLCILQKVAWRRSALIYGAAWLLVFVQLFLDPFEVLSWYAD